MLVLFVSSLLFGCLLYLSIYCQETDNKHVKDKYLIPFIEENGARSHFFTYYIDTLNVGLKYVRSCHLFSKHFFLFWTVCSLRLALIFAPPSTSLFFYLVDVFPSFVEYMLSSNDFKCTWPQCKTNNSVDCPVFVFTFTLLDIIILKFSEFTTWYP